MKSLDSVYDLKWSPRMVIEASAGTGKTYTIVGIYLRLLLENRLDIDQILVMTFTNKATSELRDRILRRLRDCADFLETGIVGNDPFLKDFGEWINSEGDEVDALNRLKAAIHNFDDGRVFTIHGFCQKVLKEEALLAGVPFDMEVIQNDDLLLQAAEDFWRSFMNRHSGSNAGRYYISKLLSIANTPGELIGREGLGNLFGKASADIEGEVFSDPLHYLEKIVALRLEISALWKNERGLIEKELLESELSGYTDRNVTSRVAKMDKFAGDLTFSTDTFDQLKYFTSSHVHDEGNLLKNKTRLPGDIRFFHVCDEYRERIAQIGKLETTLIREVYSEVSKGRQELSNSSSALTYDDLLTKLRDVLKDPERGRFLSDKLLKSYPFALVDEFQDTDSIQYSILDSIYPKEGNGIGLMMIGDPKQAIYAFRGADIYTYFRAKKEGSPRHYSLQKNYRSTPALIDAVNKLFENDGRKPFIEQEIEFFSSEAGLPGSSEDYLVNNAPPVPFRITIQRGISSSKTQSRDFSYDETVTQVANLLEHESIEIKDDSSNKMRPLEAGDIAILVSGHRDASEIKYRLKEVGIDAVTYSQEKVFDSFEAKRMQMVMGAVLDPLNSRELSNALLSGLFGTGLNRLHTLKESEPLRQALIEELQELQERWIKSGFMAMYRALLFKKGRLDQLAELKNSERIITNLNQLADICSKKEIELKMDPHSLHSWFLREMARPEKDDEQALLLESDQNLVKISTIHGSKGLQFPVVICPTLWEGRDPNKKDFLEYHKEGSDRITINIDQQETDNRVRAENQNAVEAIAEEVRKMYVAMTRAKYECRVIWSTHNQSHLSGLGASLLGRDKAINGIGKKLKDEDDEDEISGADLTDSFNDLAANNPGVIRVIELDEQRRRSERVRWNRMGTAEITSPAYSGRIHLPVQKRVESFSSLANHKAESGEPDYDQVTDWYVDAVSGRSEEKGEESIFTFPRGATAGTAIHKLFEHDNFNFNTLDTADPDRIIKEVLEEYRFDEKWTAVLDKMIRDVTNADYRGLRLNEVKREEQLREMEFHFPVGKPDLQKLLAVIRDEEVFPVLAEKSQHYLTGFIDLIVRQNGKYYILDYKSNHLGDTPEHYSEEKLREEVEAARYDLQYHLYTVALVRFLRQRLPGFSYKEHFGGVMYLFVRGMTAGSDNGIWFHKPGKDIIENLDDLLRR